MRTTITSDTAREIPFTVFRDVLHGLKRPFVDDCLKFLYLSPMILSLSMSGSCFRSCPVSLYGVFIGRISMTYPSDPFGPRDPKEPMQRMGKRGLGTALYLDVSLSLCKFARNGQWEGESRISLPVVPRASSPVSCDHHCSRPKCKTKRLRRRQA